MIENLPRPILWADFRTIDRFYKIEPLNKRFHEVLKTISISLFEEKKDDTLFFNEVYYQLTRMAYERAMPASIPKYEKDIREDMGSYEGVALVMSMAYYLMSLVKKDSRLFNSFLLLTIKERYENCPYWEPFSKLYTKLSKGKRRLTYDFRPRPVPAKVLTEYYVNWQELTGDFNAGALLEILNLWSSYEDKSLLIEMVSSSVKFSSPKLQQTFYHHIEPILTKQLSESNASSQVSSELEKRIKDQDSTIMQLKRENSLFQKIIRDLQADNERMKSLLDENKQDGSARKITFIEMINYCKDSVKWDDAKEIVNMLNILLRGIGTTEDYKLLDSVRDYFKNKKHGDTFINSQIGNYKSKIQNQNLDIPMPPIGQQEQNLLEHE